MEIPQHQRRERVLMAGLQGLADAHASGRLSLEEAAAEMLAMTADPHLLAHAVGSSFRDGHAQRRALLEAAGITSEQIDEATADADAAAGKPSFLRMYADGINALGSGAELR